MRNVRPISERFVAEALEVSKFNMKELGRSGRDPEEAMKSFNDWIMQESKEQRAVFVGFNASFDLVFCELVFSQISR